MLVALSAILREPGLFLHSLDWNEDRLEFLPTTAERLRGSAFLDGRSPITDAAPVSVSLSAALGEAGDTDPNPDEGGGFIFHGSFCGSTLLARMLDSPGRTLVLREPNVLVDLANWKAALDDGDTRDDQFAPVLELVLRLLRRPWQPGETVAIKPSNWANNLIPELCGRFGPAVFMDLPVRDFLVAVFRGNRERLVLTSEAVVHLATLDRRLEPLVRDAATSTDDVFGKAARLTVLAHALQRALFLQAIRANGWGGDRLIGLDDLSRVPEGTASRAADHLGLDLGVDAIRDRVKAEAGLDAKTSGRPFSTDVQADYNRQLEEHHGARFDEAIAWGRDQLGLLESPEFMAALFGRAHVG